MNRATLISTRFLAFCTVLIISLGGCSQPQPEPVPVRANTPVPAAAAEQPRQVLLAYFSALAEGRYADAVELYGGSYEVLEGWNPEIDSRERAALWQSACRHNGLQCLGRAEVVREQVVAAGEHVLTVQFYTREGEVFVLGPCCGETEETMPPVREFDFTVRRDGERLRVHTLPVYVP